MTTLDSSYSAYF